MAIKVEIPTPLRPFAGKQASVEFNAVTVGDALKQLTTTYADLQKHFYTDEGRIRSFMTVYVNDEDIRAGGRASAAETEFGERVSSPRT